jgi:integrase
MGSRMHLTKRTIGALPLPSSGQEFYRDDQRKGLAVRVTAGGTKSFVLEKLVYRRVRRITLGRCGEISVEKAWQNAQKMLGQIADGLDPVAERKKAKAASVTLDDAFREYLKQRNLKPKSIADYSRAVSIAFSDWRRRPLTSITREAIARRFNRLRDENGPAWANLCMRLLRAIFNFANGKYADDRGQSPFAANPVKVLSETKAWAKVDRRRTVIKSHELANWYQEVQRLSNTTIRDYLLLLIFTGLRREEAARLRWHDIDLKGRTLTVSDTKNRRPHTLPLPGFLHGMLGSRHDSIDGEFVFPGDGSRGHLVSAKKSKAKVIDATGISFSLHDLRRTFTTVAESLDISAYALKRMLNHSDGSDVTAGYIVPNVERLREPMQKVADYLMRAMKIEATKLYGFADQPNDRREAVHSA